MKTTFCLIILMASLVNPAFAGYAVSDGDKVYATNDDGSKTTYITTEDKVFANSSNGAQTIYTRAGDKVYWNTYKRPAYVSPEIPAPYVPSTRGFNSFDVTSGFNSGVNAGRQLSQVNPVQYSRQQQNNETGQLIGSAIVQLISTIGQNIQQNQLAEQQKQSEAQKHAETQKQAKVQKQLESERLQEKAAERNRVISKVRTFVNGYTGAMRDFYKANEKFSEMYKTESFEKNYTELNLIDTGIALNSSVYHFKEIESGGFLHMHQLVELAEQYASNHNAVYSKFADNHKQLLNPNIINRIKAKLEWNRIKEEVFMEYKENIKTLELCNRGVNNFIKSHSYAFTQEELTILSGFLVPESKQGSQQDGWTHEKWKKFIGSASDENDKSIRRAQYNAWLSGRE